MSHRHHQVLWKFLGIALQGIGFELRGQAPDRRESVSLVGKVHRQGVQHGVFIAGEVDAIDKNPVVLKTEFVDCFLGPGVINAFEDREILVQNIFVGLQEGVVGTLASNPVEVRQLVGDSM